MGELIKSHGDQWRYVINDFSGGWYAPGSYVFYPVNQSSSVGDKIASGLQCYESFAGELTPVVGDSKFNATSFSGSGDVNLIFPYILPSSAGTYLELFVRGTTLSSSLAGAAAVTEGTVGAVTATRYAAQALGYCWIARSNGQMFRFNKNNPGGGTTVSNAGTKAPTNAPTTGTLVAGGSLTVDFGYKYRYAWEYGTSRELGMGWRQCIASEIITPTTGNQSVTVTMDANPPTSWSHAVSRALFRNTRFFPDNYFLVTRTPYTGSSLATTYLDGNADSLIENGEECDPPNPQATDTSAGDYSELLPVTFTFPTIHEGRMWGLDAWNGAVRYPSRAVYSRVSNVGPAPRWDQFDTFATVEAAPSDMGAPNGLVSWMGNLYALFERGITVLSTDPGVARLPTFATVVAGRGPVSPNATAATPFGIVMMSGEGPILFDGGPSPIILSEAISGILRGLNLSTAVGGYDPQKQEYSFTVSGTSTLFTYNFNTKVWNDGLDVDYVNSPWTYAASVGKQLHYGINNSVPSKSDGFVFIRKGGTTNQSLTSGKALQREYVSWYLDCMMPYVQKRLRWIRVRFADVSSATAVSVLNVLLASDDGTTLVQTAFPTTTSRVFTFSYSGQVFVALRIQMTLDETEAPGTSTFPGRLVAIEVCFEGNPERIYSKAVA